MKPYDFVKMRIESRHKFSQIKWEIKIDIPNLWYAHSHRDNPVNEHVERPLDNRMQNIINSMVWTQGVQIMRGNLFEFITEEIQLENIWNKL